MIGGGGAGDLHQDVLEIDFLVVSDRREWLLSDTFYQIKKYCSLGCALFSKFLGHNPLLVDLDDLNWMVPEFSKLDIGKLLLAGVLCLVTWHSRDRSRDLVTTINSNCARLSAKIARMGCRSFEHSAPIYSYTTWSWFNYCPFKSNRMYMFTFEILIIILLW